MSSALDITRSVNPPRAAFLDFQLGHTTGKPHDPELQHAILGEALRAFETISAPGTIVTLPFRWSDDERWKDEAMAGGDERTPRYDTAQYQTEDDRRRAEACEICAS